MSEVSAMRNDTAFSCTLWLLAASSIAGLAGCTDHDEAIDSDEQTVVYGADNRRDVYDFEDQVWAGRAAEFTAAMIGNSTIDASNPDNIRFQAGTLREDFNVCPGERFADQITAASCSATLIAPDLVLTAGHCINSSSCSGNSFVFDYYMTSASALHAITSDDVYRCQQVVAHQLANNIDFAIARLDRPVTGRTPASVDATVAALANSTPLIVNGYGSGLPLKIDNGAQVRDARAGTQDFFVANLDTFGGNSGSGVFRSDTGKLVGILVRGETDYVRDGTCNRVNVCSDSGCSGESSTYAHRAITALCAAGPGPLCTCGDGTCDPQSGESSATCPADCGSQCGDGVCNGGETPESCPADCTRPSDDGDTCAAPLTITAQGTQTATGSTATAHDDFAGTCVGGDAPDRVYTFTLTRRTTIDARVTGFDTGLYLRTGCDTGSELVCNDDSNPPGGFGSRVRRRLEAGTYYLVVDGFGTNSGTYNLTVTFTP